MRPDPVIVEIRRIRHEISAEHGHDPKRLLEYYQEFQKQFGDRLVDYGGRKLPATAAEAETAPQEP